MAANEPLVQAKDVAAYLLIHEKTVRQMAAQGRLPALRIGKVWRFRMCDIDKWVTEQMRSGK